MSPPPQNCERTIVRCLPVTHTHTQSQTLLNSRLYVNQYPPLLVPQGQQTRAEYTRTRKFTLVQYIYIQKMYKYYCYKSQPSGLQSVGTSVYSGHMEREFQGEKIGKLESPYHYLKKKNHNVDSKKRGEEWRNKAIFTPLKSKVYCLATHQSKF